MLQFKNVFSAHKAVMLVSTALLATGCNTIAEQNFEQNTADSQKAAETYDVSDADALSMKRLMRMAEKSWKRGDKSTAMRLYTLAGQKSPNNPAPMLAMADILRKSKRPDTAMKLYKRVAERYPEMPDAHAGIGYVLLTQDKPYLAAKSFETAVELDNKNSKSLGGLALALDTAGEHEKAQDYYRLAIQADPNNLTYQNNLALSLALIGRTDQAIAMFEIITTHPNATAQHRQNMALVYGMAGKTAEAMKYSRMDLNEKDARNNALYFEALNSKSEPSKEQEQVYAMAARSEKSKGRNHPARGKDLYTDIATSSETVAVETRTRPEPAPEQMIASRPSVDRPKSDYREFAAEPKSVETVIATNVQDEKAVQSIATAPVVAAPVVEVASAPLEKPKAPGKSEPVAVAAQGEVIDKPVTYQQPKVQKAAFVAPKLPVKTGSGSTIYYIQLGSFRTAERAERGWKVIQSENMDLLATYEPVYSIANLGSEKGIYYRVRIGGFADKSEPTELCSQLKSRNTDCYLPYMKVRPDYTRVAHTSNPAFQEENDTIVEKAVAKRPLQNDKVSTLDTPVRNTAFVEY